MYSCDKRDSWDCISDAFYPDWLGGLQRYASELASAAQNAGVDSTIWTRVWSRDGLMSLQRELNDAPIHLVGLGMPSRFRGVLITIASLAGMRLSRRLSGSVRIAHTAVLGNLFLNGDRTSIQIYVFHASASLELRAKAVETGTFTTRKRLHCQLLKILEKRCLRKADKVVVLSEYSRSIVEQISPTSSAKVVVIPGGTKIKDGGRWEAESFPRAKKIVTVRRLEWRMGLDLLLEAFARSGIAADGWTLEIVGSGSELGALVRLADELDIASAVTFTGRVSDEEKDRILREASLFVLPTRAHEGFGLATVEAMAAGAIPIVTSVGASPEIVGQLDHRLICSADAGSLTEVIQHWTSPQRSTEYDSLRSRSREIAAKYGWDVVYSQWEELIRSIVPSSRQSQ